MIHLFLRALKKTMKKTDDFSFQIQLLVTLAFVCLMVLHSGIELIFPLKVFLPICEFLFL